MATVTPPPPPAAPPPQPAGQPTVVVEKPSPSISSLPAGARLTGVIVPPSPGADTPGRVIIQTDLGRIVLQTNLPLPRDGSIELQAQPRSGLAEFLVTSLQGRPPLATARLLNLSWPGLAPPAKGATAQSTQTGSPTTGITAPISAAPVQLTRGSVVTATLLLPSSGSALSPSAQIGKPAASTSPLSGGTAASNPAPATTARSGSITAGNLSTSSTHVLAGRPVLLPRGPSLAPGSSPLPSGSTSAAGSQFSVRIAAVSPPGSSLPPTPNTFGGGAILPGQLLSGTVSHHGAGGQSVVQTAAGPVALSTSTPVIVGGNVSFEVVKSIADRFPVDSQAVSRKFGQLLLESRQWPALKEAIGHLQEANPGAAQQVLNSVLPRADAALAVNVLLFISAIRGGDLRGWIGDAPLRALQRARPDAIGRLREDMSHMARVADEPTQGDWRTLSVPFVNGREIEQIHLYLQRDARQDEDEDDEPAQGTRFIVDVELSRIGRVQLDGTVRESDKRFDMIVRTDAPLSTEVQNGIRRIFEDANGITGTQGGLAFQAAPPGFVDVSLPSPIDGTTEWVV